MTVAYGRGDQGRATRLHSLIVRARGRCARCGSVDPTKLQCAHIIKRRFSATRCDLRNAWCLCASCHFRLETHPDEHMAFVAQTIGMELFDELKALALAGPAMSSRLFWRAEVDRLRSIAQQEGIAA